MRNKMMMAGLALAVAGLTGTPVAQAGAGALHKVDAVAVGSTGTLHIVLESAFTETSGSCSDKGRFKVAINDARYEAIQSLALSALLSGRSVYFEADASACVDGALKIAYVRVDQ